MSPPKQQQQFTIPTQLSKSKITLRGQKMIRKQNLRSKANIPKMKVDSENQDNQQQQEQLAYLLRYIGLSKRKAKKWWKSFNKKYYSIFNSLQDAGNIISETQQLPVGGERLGTYFQEEILNQDPQNHHILQRKDTLKVLFRRETLVDSQQYNALIVYELNPDVKTEMIDEEEEIQYVSLNGQTIEVALQSALQGRFPANLGIWAFRNPIKQSRTLSLGMDNHVPVPTPHNLTFCTLQDSPCRVQQLLKLEKQQHSQNTIDHQLTQWTNKYREIFEQNQKALQTLALRIQENIDKRKLQEELKQRQEEIVIITQKQLLWSQILLLFKKGHSDKTEQLLNDAMEIRTIMQMNMKESLKKKKSTSQQKLKSLFQTDCKICFSTQSDEKINKVFYCDGCNTSFHQICYGISKEEAQQILKLEKFYCDVCAYYIETKPQFASKKSISSVGLENEGKVTEKAETKQKKPGCQVCCKSNFPMKLINGHFYHVTCLFMFDFVAEVNDYKIGIKQGVSFNQICMEVIENELEGSLCEFCLKYQGMKFKCSTKGCNKWYHPICAYLNGIYFNLHRNYRKLDVKMYCQVSDHQLCLERNIINQIYIRRFFCDYRKTSNLNEEDFQEQYGKEIKEVSKERAKQIGSSFASLIMRKTKKDKAASSSMSNCLSNSMSNSMSNSSSFSTSLLPQTGSTLAPGTTSTFPSPNNSQRKGGSQTNPNSYNNYESWQNSRMQSNMGESSQQNQLQRERTQLFMQKMHHDRFIEEDLEFD